MTTPTQPGGSGSGGSGSTSSGSTTSGPSTGSGSTPPHADVLLIHVVTNWTTLTHHWENRGNPARKAIRVAALGWELLIDLHLVASDFEPRFGFGSAYVRNGGTGNDCNVNDVISHTARGAIAADIGSEFNDLLDYAFAHRDDASTAVQAPDRSSGKEGKYTGKDGSGKDG